MPYITREDGERFVIPSYRDVLSAKSKNSLKRDILLLSQSYGEYITLQKKTITQYEVAFSPDTGYLLGESVWQYFKRPLDLIYCEAIPNTTEAILVIVKAGSVYLDGSFPLDSIPEELIIFLTQQNNFEIYIYGDVPISQEAVAGKFSFEPSSVKSFNVLEKPIFPNLPLLKMYQLQPVEIVLKAQGIGGFTARQLMIGLGLTVLGYVAWSYYTPRPGEVVQVQPEQNPFQVYIDLLKTPDPSSEINDFTNSLQVFLTIPGWVAKHIEYARPNVTATMVSDGGEIRDLMSWAEKNDMAMVLKPDGVYVTKMLRLTNRHFPAKIYPVKDVIANFLDRLSKVYPGNHVKLNDFENKGVYTDVQVTVMVDEITPILLTLIGQQLKDLPFSLQSIVFDIDKGSLTGTIVIDALGN